VKPQNLDSTIWSDTHQAWGQCYSFDNTGLDQRRRGCAVSVKRTQDSLLLRPLLFSRKLNPFRFNTVLLLLILTLIII